MTRIRNADGNEVARFEVIYDGLTDDTPNRSEARFSLLDGETRTDVSIRTEFDADRGITYAVEEQKSYIADVFDSGFRIENGVRRDFINEYEVGAPKIDFDQLTEVSGEDLEDLLNEGFVTTGFVTKLNGGDTLLYFNENAEEDITSAGQRLFFEKVMVDPEQTYEQYGVSDTFVDGDVTRVEYRFVSDDPLQPDQFQYRAEFSSDRFVSEELIEIDASEFQDFALPSVFDYTDLDAVYVLARDVYDVDGDGLRSEVEAVDEIFKTPDIFNTTADNKLGYVRYSGDWEYYYPNDSLVPVDSKYTGTDLPSLNTDEINFLIYEALPDSWKYDDGEIDITYMSETILGGTEKFTLFNETDIIGYAFKSIDEEPNAAVTSVCVRETQDPLSEVSLATVTAYDDGRLSYQVNIIDEEVLEDGSGYADVVIKVDIDQDGNESPMDIDIVFKNADKVVLEGAAHICRSGWRLQN